MDRSQEVPQVGAPVRELGSAPQDAQEGGGCGRHNAMYTHLREMPSQQMGGPGFFYLIQSIRPSVHPFIHPSLHPSVVLLMSFYSWILSLSVILSPSLHVRSFLPHQTYSSRTSIQKGDQRTFILDDHHNLCAIKRQYRRADYQRIRHSRYSFWIWIMGVSYRRWVMASS